MELNIRKKNLLRQRIGVASGEDDCYIDKNGTDDEMGAREKYI